ncbi:MAG: hypothetical protein HKO07_04475 [Pseudomonadales bacterium]|nr:hypothetical protein [Pseudomonadales bacterium]
MVCASVQAQYGNYSEADMQRMMEQAQKGAMQAQQCFAGIDPAAVQKLADRGNAIEQKIAALCKSGQEAEAMSEAMVFGREIAADKDVAAMRKCGEQMKGMLPDIPFADFKQPDDPASKSQSLCAGYK